MEPKIPLPTDNIYKFYALFGLMLLITSILGTILVNTSTNEKLYELIKEYEAIPKEQKEKSKSTLAEVIEKLIDVQIKNKYFFLYSLGATSGISIILMWYGFRQWHTKIQPKQDELFELQLSKLRKELEHSNK
jgi:uncharacterized Tic20 family protein